MIGIAESITKPVQRATEELLNRALDDQRVADICARIRDAQERHLAGQTTREEYHDEKSALKKGLPIMTPHATFGPSGRRVCAEAVPTGFFMMDYDDVNNAEALFHEHIEPLIGAWGVALAAQTPGGGLRVVATIPAAFRETMTPELAIAGAQMSFAQAAHLPKYDVACKDLARCSFLVPRDYVYYMDMPRLLAEAEPWPEIHIPEGYGEQAAPFFCVPPGTFDEDIPGLGEEHDENPASTSETRQSTSEPGESPGENAESPSENAENTAENAETPDLSPTFRGLKYADIIQEWFRQTGGEPQRGERNSRLHQLACNLRGITDNDPELMLRIMPHYGLSVRERKALINSALKGERFGISASMKRVLARLQNPDGADPRGNATSTAGADTTAIRQDLASTRTDPTAIRQDLASTPRDPASTPTDVAPDALNTHNIPADAASDAMPDPPPAMPDSLPSLISLLLAPIPEIYRPAVAHAVFPPLAVHLWKTRFPYADNILHECTLMNVLLAETGAGKDCISMPINLIMQDIRARDRENLRREAEWKKEMSTKSANVDKSQRPAGLVIQEIDPDVTNAAFVMRLHEAEDHFLYTRMNEIDQFDALKGNGRTGQHFQIMCLNFDPENRYGQTRVGWNSVTEKVQVRFNWNASSTLVHGKNYFSRVVLNGPISRINFCTIPQRPLGASIPRYGRYSPDEKIAIKTYIDRLNSTTGIITDPRLVDLANKLIEHCNTRTILSQDRIYENLSFRACVIAWLKICLLFVANGMMWEESFLDFALWSLDYDLHCKMAFFGDLINNAQDAENKGHVYQASNLLELLPPVFTRQQAMAIRKLRGKPEDPSNMLYMWKQRNHIIQIGEDTYQKI